MDKEQYKEIKFTIDGSGVTPEALGKDLLTVLQDFWVLTSCYSSEQIGITAVENNCVSIKFLVPLAFSCATLIGSTMPSNTNIAHYTKSAKSINHTLQKYNATLSCFDEKNVLYAKFDENNKIPEYSTENIPLQTTMTFYGELVDVGGSGKINAHIKVPQYDKLVILDVTKEKARLLAPKLFSSVGVIAEVKIVDENIEGKIIDIVEYEPTSLDAWLDEEALPQLGKIYEGVNVEEFLNKLREEEEQNE